MEKDDFFNRWNISTIDEVIFQLDSDNQFIVYLFEPVQELILPSAGKILWYQSKKKPIELVSPDEYSISHAFRDTYTNLRDLFLGKLEYSPMRECGIGYEWNQILAHDPQAPLNREECIRRYRIWSSYHGYDTWIYTQNGKIFLEITPFYAWTTATIAAQGDDTLEAFRERMLAYKPLALFEMSREVAEQWYQQAKDIVAIIYKNYERDGGPHVDIETQI